MKAGLLKAATTAASIAVSLLLLEVGLHVYFRVSEGYWLFLGQENFKVPFAMLVPDARVYSLRPNSTYDTATIGGLGFRNSPDAPVQREVICVLGDSVPFGAGAADNESVPFHLQQIASQNGWPVGVLNAAVPSYTWNQAFLRWKIDVSPRYHCKLFVVSAANDASLMLFYKERWRPTTTWAEQNLNMRPVRSWATAYFFGLALEQGWRQMPSKDYLQTDLVAFDQNLRAIVAEMARIAPVIVLPITACYYTDRPLSDPSNGAACDNYKGYRENAENWADAVAGINEKIRGVADQRVIFVDTAKLLDRDRAGFFVDGMHFSDKGARVIASYLAQVIENEHLMRPQGGR